MNIEAEIEHHLIFMGELKSYIKDCLTSGLTPKEVRESLDYLAVEIMKEIEE